MVAYFRRVCERCRPRGCSSAFAHLSAFRICVQVYEYLGLGKYFLDTYIGGGTFGSVYEAVVIETGKRVAVKIDRDECGTASA